MLSFEACALSDVGRTRTANEDFFAIDDENGLYLVADGMGGHGNGEIASRLAVEAIRQFFGQSNGRRGRSRDRTERRSRLRLAIDRANQRVLGAVDRDASLGGMGTTLVALQLREGVTATLGHVGDSRAYRLRERRLKRLTNDHTWVNEQLSAGNLSESQARNHPFKSVVTRALGGDQDVQAELCELRLAPGDVYLLCSDGLTTMLPDEQIEKRLVTDRPLRERCSLLVHEANEKGGRDNVTVLLLAVGSA